MLTVTDAAGERLASLLSESKLPDEIAVRLVIDGQSIGLRQDSERPGDQTIQHRGRTIVLLDEEAAELLTDDTLDVDGDGLTLHHAKEGG